MKKMLSDRVAIITGSGRGIGRETALLFAEEGAKIVVHDIDAQPAEETLREIRKTGNEAAICIGDVTDPNFAEDIVKTAVQEWGALHIIVNNAGYTQDALIHKMTDEEWDRILDLHLKAPFRIIRAAAPYFRDSARCEMEEGQLIPRKIVNVSSLAGLGGNVGQANYASAKSGVIGLTKAVSKEWARYNIQCNCVAFGFIDTRLTREKGPNIQVGGKEVQVGIPAKQREKFVDMIPAGRVGTPKEAANVLLFFSSPLSNYVSGQVLIVSGGLSI